MTTWLFYALADVLLFGIAAVLEKTGAKKNNPSVSAALWGTVIAVFSFIILRYTGSSQSLLAIAPRSVLFLVLAGLALGGSWLCFFRSLKTGEIIKIIPVCLMNGVIAMVARMICFGTRYRAEQIVAMIVLFVGTLFVVLHSGGAGRGKSKGSGYIWLLFASLSALLLATATILCEYGVSDVNGYMQNTFMVVVALVMVWIVAMVSGGPKYLRSMSFLDGVWLCLGAAAIGLAWFALYFAKAYGPDAVVVHIDRLGFLAVLLFGCMILRERLSWRGVIGMVLLVVGVFLMLLEAPFFSLIFK